MRAIGDPEEMEEERRLCYVAITRAKQRLYISHAKQRMIYGRTAAALPSRFLREIPEEYLERKGSFRPRAEGPAFSGSYGGNASYGGGYTGTRQTAARSDELKRAYAEKSAPTASLELNKGDMVKHAAFGKGMVLSVMKMGGDALLEIAFDDIGTKKLMAKTASPHMKKL